MFGIVHKGIPSSRQHTSPLPKPSYRSKNTSDVAFFVNQVRDPRGRSFRTAPSLSKTCPPWSLEASQLVCAYLSTTEAVFGSQHIRSHPCSFASKFKHTIDLMHELEGELA